MQNLRQLFLLKNLICFLAFLVFCSCNRPRHETVMVDFGKENEGTESQINDSIPVLRVAIATVISPRESFNYYKELFDYISTHMNLPVEFKQRLTYTEVNELMRQNQIDIAFVCAGAYVVGEEFMELLVVPVHDGLPYYQGFIITQQNSGIDRFEDFQGKTFTYSDPLCFTGKLYIDSKLAEMGLTSDEFFSRVMFSTSHDISIQMVSRNLIDGASVNGLIYDYLAHFKADAVRNVKIIEKSAYFGIPPIVNSKQLPEKLKNEIQELFLGLHLNEEGRNIMQNLRIDKFILAGDTLYDGIREVRNRLEQ